MLIIVKTKVRKKSRLDFILFVVISLSFICVSLSRVSVCYCCKTTTTASGARHHRRPGRELASKAACVELPPPLPLIPFSLFVFENWREWLWKFGGRLSCFRCFRTSIQIPRSESFTHHGPHLRNHTARRSHQNW